MKECLSSLFQIDVPEANCHVFFENNTTPLYLVDDYTSGEVLRRNPYVHTLRSGVPEKWRRELEDKFFGKHLILHDWCEEDLINLKFLPSLIGDSSQAWRSAGVVIFHNEVNKWVGLWRRTINLLSTPSHHTTNYFQNVLFLPITYYGKANDRLFMKNYIVKINLRGSSIDKPISSKDISIIKLDDCSYYIR